MNDVRTGLYLSIRPANSNKHAFITERYNVVCRRFPTSKTSFEIASKETVFISQC